MKTLKIGNITLEQESETVKYAGEYVELLPHEFRLLAYLMQYPDEARTYKQIADAVWSGDVTIPAIRACVRRLRIVFWSYDYVGKLWIQNVLKVGYKFNSRVDE